MPVDNNNLQSIYVDEVLFFFMRIQKCHCRHMVGRLKRKHPSDTAIKLANRIVNAQVMLSFTASVLSNVPSVISSGNKPLRIIGIAGGSVILSRMHISLILKIALLFGKDIDDNARVPEIIAVIAATIPALLVTGSGRYQSNTSSIVSFATAGAMGAATAYIIGKAAISYYSKEEQNILKKE